MKKAVLFNKLIQRFPFLSNLSARRFSSLSRWELYWIIKSTNAAKGCNQFGMYMRLSTKDLANLVYNKVKELY